MRWTVVLLIRSVGVTNDTVAYFEASDTGADFDDLAGGVDAEDAGVFEPGEHHLTHVLDEPVEWIDGYGALGGASRVSVPSS